MDPNLVGNSAAIFTAFLWAGSSILFTSAGKRIGFLCVNAYRSAIALGMLVCAHVILLGFILPIASSQQWFWLGLSGIVGLGIGDFGLFAAYILIGPRRTLLIMASSPIFASVGAFLILGETIQPLAVLGIAITLTGIVVVILEKEAVKKSLDEAQKKRKVWGMLAATIAATGQGVGLVLSKLGMYTGESMAMNPVSAALIRMIIAAVFVWICALFLGKLPELRETAKDKKGLKFVSGGAFVGPFLGMTLSLFAVSYTQASIAQTLISLEPLIIIPLVWMLFRERTNLRGIFGAALAVVGVALLMLS